MKRLVAVALLLLAASAGGTAGRPVVGDLATAVDHAPAGAVLRVPAGRHPGPVRVERPITLVFEADAVVVAPADGIGIEIVETRDVHVDGADVVGGKHGVVVRHSTGVRVEDVSSKGAKFHGIFAQNSELVVADCRVAGLRSSLAQGVEIINSDRQPPSTVRGCRVSGPAHEGIVSHVSEVTFADNVVTGTTERGVSITEMSHGRAVRNVVRDSRGTAYWCGDMSECVFVDNSANGVDVSTPGFRSSEGHGLVVQFHSHATVGGFRATDVEGHPVLEMSGSVTSRAPSRLPSPGPLLLLGVMLVAAPAALARFAGINGWRLVLTTALGVQLVHQAEHVVQVAQAKVLDHDTAHGLAGAAFDNEWVHLEFNTLLLVALIALVVSGVRNRPLVLAVAVQGYHEVEHVTKVVQYVRDGLLPAPGLLGARADLVWFHFTINLLVLLLIAGAAVVSHRAQRVALGPPSGRFGVATVRFPDPRHSKVLSQ